MKYYTNVYRQGNRLFIREVRDGKRRKFKHEYRPTLYVPTTKPSKLQAPDGTPVEPIQPGLMGDCYQFIQRYKDVGNFRIYGNTGYEYAFLNEEYPGSITYKLSEMVVCNLDIEVESKNGYSEASDAMNQITAITMKSSLDGIFHVFAYQPFDDNEYNRDHPDTHIVYHDCEDEYDLLYQFLDLWETLEPDIVTGWNCLPTNASVWGKDRIQSLSTVRSGDMLHDSVCVRRFPLSHKPPYTVTLSNGSEIVSSADHLFPIAYKPKEHYSSLTFGQKSRAQKGTFTMRQLLALRETNDVYLDYTLRDNTNVGVAYDGAILGNDIFYALGMLYTDGSAVMESRAGLAAPVVGGLVFYNTDRDLLERVKLCVDKYSIRRINHPDIGYTFDERGKGTWRLKTSLGPGNPFTRLSSLVLGSDGTKCLNLPELSTLSRQQFQSFLAGAIDGDGSVDGNAFILVDYTPDGPAKWQELLAWNGVLSYRSNARLRLPFDSRNTLLHNLPLALAHKAALCSTTPFVRRHASNKNLSLAPSTNGYWVRIDDISISDTPVPMLDIETDTHYFNSAGIRTHNCRLYDIPYLVNRISRIMSADEAKRMSPWGIIKESTVNIFNNPEVVYDLAGISVLDYLLIYRKNVLEPRESYRLDYIAQVELNERKVDYGEYGNLQTLYEKNFKKFIEYNIHDVRLVDRIDAKRKLIELQLIVAYHAKVNYVDVLSQVRTWDTNICNHLLAKGVVIPQKSDVTKDTQFAGAFVMKPQVGMHEWVASFDVQSLYPTIMRTLNMGMETKLPIAELTPEMRRYQSLINKTLMIADEEGKLNVNPEAVINGLTDELMAHLKERDVTVGANGIFYRRDPKSFYCVMIEELFNNRLEYKAKLKKAKKELSECTNPQRKAELETEVSIFDLKQHATKIMLNSLYGAMGNQYFRFFDVQNAEAVTTTGQFIIQYVGRGIDKYLNTILRTEGKRFVVYSDTDSVYVTLKAVVEKFHPHGDTMAKCNFVDKICKEAIQKEIDRLFRLITERYVNGVGEYLLMNREVIGDKAIWTAKKRYLVNVRDKEGIRKDPPELKYMGLEIAKSSVPKFCREAMKEAVKIVMEKDQLTLFRYIADTKVKFTQQRIEDISFPRGVNGLDKYGDSSTIFTKGTPFHTKGVLMYNYLLDKLSLGSKYSRIKDGEKMKYFHLREPNTVNSPVMAFLTSLPTEFGLDPYIDWEMQWTKTFIEPLKLILSAIGWDTQKRASLDDLFYTEDETPSITPAPLPWECDDCGCLSQTLDGACTGCGRYELV